MRALPVWLDPSDISKSNIILCVALSAQVKEEGWWLVAGDAASGDLYAIKRVSFGQRTTTK